MNIRCIDNQQLLQKGQTDKALDHARKAVEADPASFESRFNLGAILVTKSLFDEGIEQFREAQKLRPDDPRPTERIKMAEAEARKSAK